MNPETGWVNGELVNPLPSEPFLLITTDGGKSWHRKAILEEGGESRLGTIQQFYFTDKSTGKLVIDRGKGSDGDRYELYESPNGGETWGIKQSNRRPISIAHPEPEAASLRLRADGSTRALQLERRQGTRWTPVSSFAVRAGSCPAP